MIDAAKATHADTKFIVVGLNPAPKENLKTFAGGRYVSEIEVFEAAIKQYGEAYKTVCVARTNTSFLQISHVFNPEISYPIGSVAVSLRSASTINGATDHVHPNAVGYGQIADALFYKTLYDYCR